MLSIFRLSLAGLLISAASSFARAEEHLGLHFGFTVSKSVLGVSYASGKNEFNGGIKAGWFGARGYGIQPGLSYNRYFTGNGFYGSLSYAPLYESEEVSTYTSTGPNPGDYVIESSRVSGWDPGFLSIGLGKTFQWTSWGIDFDASLLTPASGDLGRTWGYWIGAGTSYRFKLD
jgi:hypothetical protein